MLSITFEIVSQYSESSIELSIASDSSMYSTPQWSPSYSALLSELYPSDFPNYCYLGPPPLLSLTV